MLVQDNFDFNKEYRLEDERVILRPLSSLDAAELAIFVRNEPEIWKYSLVAIHKLEDLQGYIDTAIQSRIDKTSYPFIVFDKQLNKYVGSTRFYDIQLNFESTQLGYTWYSKEVWGTKLNAHCKFLLLQFAFEQMGCKRVEFRADNDNKSFAKTRWYEKRFHYIKYYQRRMGAKSKVAYKKANRLIIIKCLVRNRRPIQNK